MFPEAPVRKTVFLRFTSGLLSPFSLPHFHYEVYAHLLAGCAGVPDDAFWWHVGFSRAGTRPGPLSLAH
jgi:hypothetical protein